jgi:aminomethyltransferase
MAAGKPHDIKPTGPSDIRRIEAGILNWGADITLAETPYHVGLERLVDEEKGADYLGRDALRRVKEKGVDRKLVGVEIGGDRISFNPTRWPVSAAGRPVGHITSAIYSPRMKKNIAYAMVPVSHAAPGTKLSTSIPEVGERPATVVAMPFVDPQKEIPKG